MAREIITKTLNVSGITNKNDGTKLETKLKNLHGILDIKIKYADEIVQITYDSEQITLPEMIKGIEDLGLKIKQSDSMGNKSELQKTFRDMTIGKKLTLIGAAIFCTAFIIQVLAEVTPKNSIASTMTSSSDNVQYTPIKVKDLIEVIEFDTVSLQAINRDNSGEDNPLNDTESGPANPCCAGATPSGDFANGNIPTDNIYVPPIADGIQQATVTVSSYGFSPAVIVLQKGSEFTINFITDEVGGCSSLVYFPQYHGKVDLTKTAATPVLAAEDDFNFECGMGMLHGYVKVVDNINDIDLEAVKKDVQNFMPDSSSKSCITR